MIGGMMFWLQRIGLPLVAACTLAACGKKESSGRNEPATRSAQPAAVHDAAPTPFVCPATGEVEFCGQRFRPDVGIVTCAQTPEATDLRPLGCLTHLDTLTLHALPANDLEPLAKLTNLRNLGLSKLPASDIAPLAKLTKLESLMLMDLPTTDLAPIAGLTNLQQLELDDLRVSDVHALTHLKELTWLKLEDMPVEDLSPLANLEKIQYLILTTVPMRDLAPLASLRHLHDLTLATMPFGRVKARPLLDLQPLASIPLEKLALYGLTVRDLLPVAEIRTLKTLRVDMLKVPTGQLEQLRQQRPDIEIDGTPSKEVVTPP